jgi:hypothetical protein
MMARSARQVFVLLTCAAVVIWSVSPGSSHVPKVIETLQQHAEVIQSHGHSHGLQEDLIWAMHGHSHDAVDHDHSQAVLLPGRAAQPATETFASWRSAALSDWTPPHFRLERPPRV